MARNSPILETPLQYCDRHNSVDSLEQIVSCISDYIGDRRFKMYQQHILSLMLIIYLLNGCASARKASKELIELCHQISAEELSKIGYPDGLKGFVTKIRAGNLGGPLLNVPVEVVSHYEQDMPQECENFGPLVDQAIQNSAVCGTLNRSEQKKLTKLFSLDPKIDLYLGTARACNIATLTRRAMLNVR